MPNPIKILEIKDTDWMKGLSLQSDIALGGLFQTALNFNPFERMGYFQGTLAPVAIDPTTITTQINHLTVEGDGFAYGIGDRAATAAKSFYRIQLSNNTVIDYSTAIDQNAPTGALTHNGITTYAGVGETLRVIYEQAGSLRSNTITPTAGNDLNILTTANTGGSSTPNDFCVGSDLVLYFTANAASSVGKIVTVNGTSGNTASAFALESRVQPRSLTTDGYYLIVAGDDNDTRLTTVTGKCKVYFWDKVKSTADVIWTIPDSYLIAARFVNGSVKVLGYSGIWECNLHTPPKLVYPIYNKTILPSGVNNVSVSGDLLVWASAGAGAKVYAYGSDIGKPILFNPYQTSTSSDTHTALVATGQQLLAATNHPSLYIHNTGSTRSNATIQLATHDLSRPFTFSHAKVVLRDPLSSGQQIILGLTDSNSRIIMDNTTKSYNATNPLKALTFLANPITGSITNFDDLWFTLSAIGGAVVKRLTVYGTPSSDANQTL